MMWRWRAAWLLRTLTKPVHRALIKQVWVDDICEFTSMVVPVADRGERYNTESKLNRITLLTLLTLGDNPQQVHPHTVCVIYIVWHKACQTTTEYILVNDH